MSLEEMLLKNKLKYRTWNLNHTISLARLYYILTINDIPLEQVQAIVAIGSSVYYDGYIRDSRKSLFGNKRKLTIIENKTKVRDIDLCVIIKGSGQGFIAPQPFKRTAHGVGHYKRIRREGSYGAIYYVNESVKDELPLQIQVIATEDFNNKLHSKNEASSSYARSILRDGVVIFGSIADLQNGIEVNTPYSCKEIDSGWMITN